MRIERSSLYYAKSGTPPRAALTILVDDLTGACETGVLSAARHPVTVTVWPQAPVLAAAPATSRAQRGR